MCYIQGPTLSMPSPNDLVLGEVTGTPEFALKYATPYEEYVLQEMLKLVRGQHKWVEVKIRCKDLLSGDTGMFNDKPHTDTTLDMDDPRLPEVHHLFVTPPATIFYRAKLPREVEPVFLPDYTIASYGRHALHQTPYIKTDTRRLVVRVSETNIVQPRRQVTGR